MGTRLVRVYAFVGVVLLAGAGAAYWHHRASAFAQSIWLSQDPDSEGPRLRMADRLISSEVLLGKTRSEVELMLGKPPETAYFREADMVYWLGPERGFFPIDSEWLTIKLGPDGTVTDAEIARD